MSGSIARKRIYDAANSGDGLRILVDRLWPRGMRKFAAKLDLWLKDVAPSPVLRIWFDHRADRWCSFREEYAKELSTNPAFNALLETAETRDVTLLYAARDQIHNHAVVLAEQMELTRNAAGHNASARKARSVIAA